MKKARRKKFIPEFRPQHVKAYVHHKGGYHCVQITKVNYDVNGIEVIGRI